MELLVWGWGLGEEMGGKLNHLNEYVTANLDKWPGGKEKSARIAHQ